MDRRQYIATIGTAASALSLAGCSSNDSGSDGTDGGETTDQQGALYEESDEEDMLLSLDDLPDEWTRLEGDGEDGWDRTFTNADESKVVIVSVNIHDDVAAAKAEFEETRAGFAETNDYPIADNAFWAVRESAALTMFRHSNADGRVGATMEFGNTPNQVDSQDYAKDMYETWGSL